MPDAVLTAHVAAGVAGLLAAPVAAAARKQAGLHTRAGWAYQGAVALVTATTLVLVARDPALWPFLLIVLPTQAAAAGAVLVRRRRRPGWLPQHVQLVLGSWVSLVTAFAVNTVGGTLGWLVPSVVGGLAVAVTTTRIARLRPEPALLASTTRIGTSAAG